MTHAALPDNWEELMTDYVLGNLSPQEAEQFRQLLETSPELMAEVTQLQDVLHLIPYAVAKQPPANLRAQLLARAEATAVPINRPVNRPLSLAPKASFRWLGVVGTVAAGLVAVLVSVDNYRLRQELEKAQMVTAALQQPSTLIETLTGAENAAGRVVVDAEQQQLVVIVQNLPALPDGQTYRLWAIADQTVNFWGQFETTPNGQAIAHLTLPASPSNLSNIELRITVESSNAPLTPQGAVVMQSRI